MSLQAYLGVGTTMATALVSIGTGNPGFSGLGTTNYDALVSSIAPTTIDPNQGLGFIVALDAVPPDMDGRFRHQTVNFS